jgi:tRNA pseudouridine38-40 synthase
MQKYMLVIAYDGTNYAGWQIQPNLPSITQKLQDTFARVFNKKIIIIGASRTDAGVHAHGQVASFKTDLNLDYKQMLRAWNNALPADIVIRTLAPAPQQFHPYFNVIEKTYHYHIFSEQPSPFVQRYGWHYWKSIDHEKLREALYLFIGTHDFTSFCSADVEDNNKIRTVHDMKLEYVADWKAYRITIKAPRFMRYMIRRLVGAAVKVASTPEIPVTYLTQVLDAKNANNSLPTAPAQGLMLYSIVYKTEDCS